jgi:hypothetical protein
MHTTFFDKMQEDLKKKTGKDADSLEYKDLPTEKKDFDFSLIIGNVNLLMGNVTTSKEADELVERFLETELP